MLVRVENHTLSSRHIRAIKFGRVDEVRVLYNDGQELKVKFSSIKYATEMLTMLSSAGKGSD